MTYLLEHELDRLKKRLLTLTAEVEESVQRATKALASRNVELAQKVVAGDERIDNLEVELEEECLKALALHQPVAIDLRLIVVILKMNNDLERIADLSVNIAERAIALAAEPAIDPPFDVDAMSRQVVLMLEKSLNALVDADINKAREVLILDDAVDEFHRDNYQRIKERLRVAVDEIDPVFNYLAVSRHLERIADLATNIAEDVIYLRSGAIIRHKPVS
jgi:phosphate transport system protein